MVYFIHMPETPSFIPRRSFSPPEKPRTKTVGLLSVIGGGVVALAILFSAGAYGLRLFQQNQLDALRERLLVIVEELDPATVRAMDTLDKKLALVSLLLDEHLYPSQLFMLLEKNTLPEVRFGSFAFARKDHTATLALEAKSYTDLVRQLHAFRGAIPIEDVEIGSVSLGAGGTVRTSLTLTLTRTLFQL